VKQLIALSSKLKAESKGKKKLIAEKKLIAQSCKLQGKPKRIS